MRRRPSSPSPRPFAKVEDDCLLFESTADGRAQSRSSSHAPAAALRTDEPPPRSGVTSAIHRHHQVLPQNAFNSLTSQDPSCDRAFPNTTRSCHTHAPRCPAPRATTTTAECVPLRQRSRASGKPPSASTPRATQETTSAWSYSS